MKVLAIASSGGLGGAELSLAEFLQHRPPGVEAVALLVGVGPLGARLEQQGLAPRLAAGYEGRPTPVSVARFTRSLLALLAETRPDVVWATGLKAATLAVGACRLAGVPIVWHKVDFSLDGTLTRPLGAAVNGVVGVSEAVVEALGPVRSRRLLGVVGPPVRLPEDLRLQPNEQRPTIGTLATLIPYKGQHHIIEAAGLLSQEFPQLQVVLAGGPSPAHPDYPDELRGLADRLGVADRVEFTGFVEDVSQILGRLTVFVNATWRDERGFGLEGLSGAMLEASWVGLPVVATRGGGTAEGILDGVTGTMADPADPASLARAIAPFLRDHELARRSGEAGRDFTRERFGAQVTATRLFQALGQAAGQRP